MDQKKYHKVGKNFKSSLMIGVALTIGAMTLAPAPAHAQSIGDNLKKEAEKTANDFISGIFQGIRHSGKESRTTRDTRVTAEESARREAIINGSGSGTMGQGGNMTSQRSMTVTSQNEDGTVRSTVKSDNRTAYQIEQQRQRDRYNMERQIVQAEVQQEIQRIRTGQAEKDEQVSEQLALLQAQNEALRLQLEAIQLQQGQQNNSGSTFYQPTNGGSTSTTLSERDQQMLKNCQHMQNNGATVLPEACNNLLNTTFQITTRR
ncbi:MAG: hypothetical protein EP349_09640 [Alphaproteobacteria bacterium]|nr:MAG: hypothetical protein EP349_09640 [Alphaproteobacteria bacterium]